jgi:hypothetical protein
MGWRPYLVTPATPVVGYTDTVPPTGHPAVVNVIEATAVMEVVPFVESQGTATNSCTVYLDWAS